MLARAGARWRAPIRGDAVTAGTCMVRVFAAGRVMMLRDYTHVL